jgi:hypothetical protein
MNFYRLFVSIFVLCTSISSCSKEELNSLKLLNVFIGTTELNLSGNISTELPLDRSITAKFSNTVKASSASSGVKLKRGTQEIDITVSVSGANVIIFPSSPLVANSTYTIEFNDQLKGNSGELFIAQQVSFKTVLENLKITSLKIGAQTVENEFDRIMNIPLNVTILINFSAPIDASTLQSSIGLSGSLAPAFTTTLSNNNQTVQLTANGPCQYLSKYTLNISSLLKGAQAETFLPYSRTFYTTIDPTPKFPVISDDELLTKVQQQTFKYFYDFAEPVSGMARERNTSGNLVTSGGSGFGLMALIVGIERGFITRAQGVERLTKVINFLETCDRYHGAWPHWLNGTTGKTIPFSANDNGADLVETSFLVQGLLSVRQYLNSADPAEQSLINRINTLWHGVEWDWFTREGQDVLYWHWSPDKGWAMNMPISGYNEALIVYTLAAASPTHAISPSVYTKGWARSGAIKNNRLFYNIKLPLGFDYGGPLFFTHYSFLGMNPKNLSDTYGSYWEQNVNHTLINRAYCIDNPKKFVGYSSSNWGLTASDNQSGYSAHSPTNDLGVISPTAALSSMPYAPAESLTALKFFYYTLGDRLWGEYGFYDAFNSTEGWTANSFLAIDQGPIIIMIENHRTGLVWNLFMSAPEVKNGLTNLGFTY